MTKTTGEKLSRVKIEMKLIQRQTETKKVLAKLLVKKTNSGKKKSGATIRQK